MDNRPAFARQSVDEHVIIDTPGLVAVERVVRLAWHKPGHIESGDRSEERACLRTPHQGPAEVRDIEDADSFAYGMVLADYPLVLERHLPAGEGCETGAEGFVPVPQG